MRLSMVLATLLILIGFSAIIALFAVLIRGDRNDRDARDVATALTVLAREEGVHRLRRQIPATYDQFCLLPPYTPADTAQWGLTDVPGLAGAIEGLHLDLADDGVNHVLLIGPSGRKDRPRISHVAVPRRAGGFDLASAGGAAGDAPPPLRCMTADRAVIVALGPAGAAGQQRFMVRPGVAASPDMVAP